MQIFSHRFTQINADRFKCKKIVNIILKSFYEVYNEAQLISYLKAIAIKVSLLLNFGRKPELERFIYDNKRKISAFICG